MQHIKKSLITTTAFAAGLAGFNSLSHAQLVWDAEGADDFWHTPANWTSDTVPTGGSAVIGDGNTGFTSGTVDYNATSGTTTLTTLSVGINGSGTGTLNISGGSLTAAFASGTTNSSAGNINLTGGTMTMLNGSQFGGSGQTTTLHVNGGTLGHSGTIFTQLASGGNIIMESGSVVDSGGGNRIRTTNIGAGQSAGFTVQGSNSTINWGNIQLLGAGALNWNFNADTSGVSIFNTNAFDFLDGDELNVTVDLSGYDVSNGTTLTLIDAAFGTCDDTIFDSLVVSNGSGTFSVIDDGSGKQLQLTGIVVPEPSTYALIGGCFALAAVMFRRRQA